MTNNKSIRHGTGKQTRDNGSAAIARWETRLTLRKFSSVVFQLKLLNRWGDTRTGISLGGPVRAYGAAQGGATQCEVQ